MPIIGKSLAHCCFALLLAAAVLAPAVVAAKKSSTTAKNVILSEEPRLELQRALLDQSEVKAIRALADDVGLENVDLTLPTTNGGDEVVVLNATKIKEDSFDDPDVGEGYSDGDLRTPGFAAASRVEAAAAAWAGLPLGSASPLVVTRWDPWSPSSGLNRSGLLHLDARRQRRRLRTALVYLSGRGIADDGLTVFPCIETEDMDSKEVTRRQRLCSRAQRHVQHAQDALMRMRDQGLLLEPEQQLDFLKENPALAALPNEDADGIRPVDWRWTPEHDAVAKGDAGSPRVDPLHAIAEAMCRGKAPGLRVLSRSGDALFFGGQAEAETKNKRAGASGVGRRSGAFKPDWRLWHAGCSPLKGSRWTAQVFLEEPHAEGAGACESGAGTSGSESLTCSAANAVGGDRAVA